MIKFKLTCPVCGAVAVTATPNAVIWDRCPGCKSHIWDEYDILMADIWKPVSQSVAAQSFGR